MLTVTASILTDMVAEPASLPMYNLAPGQPGKATVSLKRSGDSDATVKSIEVQNTDEFSVREIETEPGALATYEVRFKGRGVGTSATTVIIETTGKYTPTITIPVRASAAYNLRYPRRVVLVRRGKGPIERTITIGTRRGDAPRIKKIQDPDGLLDIEVEEPGGPSVAIHLRVKDGVKAAVNEPHKLLVYTNDRDEPKIEIEYRIRDAGRGAPQARLRGR